MQSQFATLMQLSSEDTIEASLNGKVYRKQLAKYQDWVNPDYPWFSDDPIMTLDEEWGDKIVENFNNNTLGSPVPVPLNHTDDVRENTGHVQSLESVPGDGLYGMLEVDASTASDIKNKKIFDVSISFAWDFVRTDDNKHYGPTLCHVALVNTPYLMGMSGFEEVGAALSRLEESIRPNSLSLAGSNVIMLSRQTMKELSKMTTLAKIKNDKTFPVTVKFKDGDEDKELVIEPDTEVEVPTEVAEDVTTQIAEAEEPSGDDSDQDDSGTDSGTDENGDNEDTKDAGDTQDEAQKELSRLQLENAELKLSREYDSLLSEGKVTPAQKDKIIGLAKLTHGVELSTTSGKKTDLASVVLDILRSGGQQFSTEESGSSAENPAKPEQDQSTEGKKPSELLTEEELAGMKAVGADPNKLDEFAEKDPVFAEALATLNRK